MAKEEKILSVEDVFKILGITSETVQKLRLEKDDPRIDNQAEEYITGLLLEHTLPGAYKAGYYDGYSCEKIAIPTVGFLFKAGDAEEIREEFSHLALRAFCLGLGQYIEHTVRPEYWNSVMQGFVTVFATELAAAIQMCARVRAKGVGGHPVKDPRWQEKKDGGK